MEVLLLDKVSRGFHDDWPATEEEREGEAADSECHDRLSERAEALHLIIMTIL